MKEIEYQVIVNAVKQLCFDTAYVLPEDVKAALDKSARTEESPLGRSILNQCVLNAETASADKLPICQDTGFAVYFVELGADIRIKGGVLMDAIQDGTRQGYAEGYLRKSIVLDPVFNRKNTGDNTPAVVHIELVSGDKLSITLAPKGGGSENMSRIVMLKPSDGVESIVQFVVDAVTQAGGNPCPPTIVGVGIGGTFEKAAYLSKKALLRAVGSKNPDPAYANLEQTILERINASGIGPQGLGGRTTALAVHIETFPCHIASMPVAVNLNCHAARHARIIL
jgi:hydro-lyases, Fe-S type, tartrate/fumarate subfamily, alpha region